MGEELDALPPLPSDTPQEPQSNELLQICVDNSAQVSGGHDDEQGRRRPSGPGALGDYQGKSVLHHRGQLVCGPPGSKIGVFTSFLLIALPSVGFIAIPGLELAEMQASPAIPIIAGLIMLHAVLFLVAAGSTDPGILPRGPAPIVPESLGEMPLLFDFEIDGAKHTLKYCKTCHIYRNMRASHCRECDNCVLDLDHHCPWVGTCVGRRNYLFFFVFVVSCTVQCFYVGICCGIHISMASSRDNGSEGKFAMQDVMRYPVSMLLAVYTFCIVWAVGSLSCFHCFLISTGLTTREYIKTQDEEETSNSRCHDVCCARTPSFIQELRAQSPGDFQERFRSFEKYAVLPCDHPIVMLQLQACTTTQNSHSVRNNEAKDSDSEGSSVDGDGTVGSRHMGSGRRVNVPGLVPLGAMATSKVPPAPSEGVSDSPETAPRGNATKIAPLHLVMRFAESMPDSGRLTGDPVVAKDRSSVTPNRYRGNPQATEPQGDLYNRGDAQAEGSMLSRDDSLASPLTTNAHLDEADELFADAVEIDLEEHAR